jgi:hypothetical protein
MGGATWTIHPDPPFSSAPSTRLGALKHGDLIPARDNKIVVAAGQTPQSVRRSPTGRSKPYWEESPHGEEAERVQEEAPRGEQMPDVVRVKNTQQDALLQPSVKNPNQRHRAKPAKPTRGRLTWFKARLSAGEK